MLLYNTFESSGSYSLAPTNSDSTRSKTSSPDDASSGHTTWTNPNTADLTLAANNGILVNGRGQPPFEWAANGTIEDYIRQDLVTIVRGLAAKSYNVPQQASVLRQWGEWSKVPVPPMDPKLESFQRTVAFVASKKRPVFVVHDQLRADAPATFIRGRCSRARAARSGRSMSAPRRGSTSSPRILGVSRGWRTRSSSPAATSVCSRFHPCRGWLPSDPPRHTERGRQAQRHAAPGLAEARRSAGVDR